MRCSNGIMKKWSGPKWLSLLFLCPKQILQSGEGFVYNYDTRLKKELAGRLAKVRILHPLWLTFISSTQCWNLRLQALDGRTKPADVHPKAANGDFWWLVLERLFASLVKSFGCVCKVTLLPWQGHLADFAKWRRFFGKVIALPWQTHCASLAMSLRFWGEWSKLLVSCEGNCWGDVLLVRGEVWQSFFACRMLVGRSGKRLAGGSFRIGAVCVTSKKGNLMPRKIQMKRLGNWKWNASKIVNGLV